ncbi:hypothetical protein KPL78_19880 [Roseomonas sp. HJA6]|uniref:Uncharacterized protein n=1 Tax=Roseomonas alba TaxID=2846776 RepID=A0ABS7AG14_9PROT|nr:hypothetical protein [Neoroseomonas alba]MBW6400129.1 hypothetical protein [Neoroseomonas alba]
MRQNAIRLAMFGLGLAATPALAQMQGGTVYSAPVATPLPAPPGYDAQMAPNAPGIPARPVTTPAYPAPNPSALPAPAGYTPQMAPNAPGIPAPAPLRPTVVPASPGYVAPMTQPAPARPVMPQASVDPRLPMQGDVLNGGDRTAAVADSVAPTGSPTALLGQAEQAARQGRLPLASELVERAETLMLTRSTIAGTEGIPIRDGAVAKLAQARVALGRRDVTSATTLMAEAASMTRSLGM